MAKVEVRKVGGRYCVYNNEVDTGKWEASEAKARDIAGRLSLVSTEPAPARASQGRVRTQEFIGVPDVRGDRSSLWVFGDNMQGWGKKGQAIIRDEPNAVGIPTKWKPATTSDSYFTNEDFGQVRAAIDAAFDRLRAHLRKGGTVVFPSSGVGTGLAQLPQRAPRIHEYITQQVRSLT